MDIRPPGKRLVRTQSMLLTLVGDYIYNRQEQFSVKLITGMMSVLGYSEASVRSALSRLCRSGWLETVRLGRKSCYSLTKKSQILLEQGHNRIFHLQDREEKWLGDWQIITYSIPEEQRNLRERLRKELTWIGFGALSHGCWISPYQKKAELDKTVELLDISDHVHIFNAEFLGYVSSKDLVTRCWDLEEVNASYREFLKVYQLRLENMKEKLRTKGGIDPQECFIERVNLVHEYRRFPFMDPGLPIELLPEDWSGFQAAEFLKYYHDFLADGAIDFVQSLKEPEIDRTTA